MVGQLAVEDLASILTRPICSVRYNMLLPFLFFALSFFLNVLRYLQIYHLSTWFSLLFALSVTSTLFLPFSMSFTFFKMFCDVSKSTINLSTLFPFLLFSLSLTFLNVLQCLQIYYQPINFDFFFTFCIECNSYFFSSLFALSFTFIIVLRCLQIYYQTINFVFFFTFCIEFNSNFLFFTFCIEFHFYKCFAMSPNLLSTYQLCFFFTFCLECNSNFLFFTFCIEFHFYKYFAMSPNLLLTYQLCFLLFALSVTLTFFSSLFALNFTFISVLRCLQIYYQPTYQLCFF